MKRIASEREQRRANSDVYKLPIPNTDPIWSGKTKSEDDTKSASTQGSDVRYFPTELIAQT